MIPLAIIARKGRKGTRTDDNFVVRRVGWRTLGPLTQPTAEAEQIMSGGGFGGGLPQQFADSLKVFWEVRAPSLCSRNSRCPLGSLSRHPPAELPSWKAKASSVRPRPYGAINT